MNTHEDQDHPHQNDNQLPYPSIRGHHHHQQNVLRSKQQQYQKKNHTHYSNYNYGYIDKSSPQPQPHGNYPNNYPHNDLTVRSNSSSMMSLVLGRTSSSASGSGNSSSIVPTHQHNVQKLEFFKITTLSNTRIDKVDQGNQSLDKNDAAINDDPKSEGLQNEEKAVLSSFPHLKILPVSTKEDSYFSYDYETYMFHITTVGKPCITLPEVPSQTKLSEHEHNDSGCSPSSTLNCNFGLELLDLSGMVIVKRCLLIPSAIQGAFHNDGSYPSGNPYEITTKTGSPIFFMTETTNCINRLLSCGWLGLTRSFTATIVDVCGRHAMDVSNVGMDLCCCCCCCCQCCCFTASDCCCISSDSKEFKVTLADGEILGYVCQTRGDQCNPGFAIKDANKHKMITGSGPKCSICERLSFILSVLCCCFSCLIDDDVFYFAERRGKRIAGVRRRNIEIPYQRNEEPFGSDMYTDYEIVIDFAEGLSVRVKALILAASFVIDFLYWQTSGD